MLKSMRVVPLSMKTVRQWFNAGKYGKLSNNSGQNIFKLFVATEVCSVWCLADTYLRGSCQPI